MLETKKEKLRAQHAQEMRVAEARAAGEGLLKASHSAWLLGHLMHSTTAAVAGSGRR